MHLTVGEVELGLGQVIASLAQQQVVVTVQTAVHLGLSHAGLAGQQVGLGGAKCAVGVVFLLLRDHVATIEGVDTLRFPQLQGGLGLQRAEIGGGGVEGGVELAVLLLGLSHREAGLFDGQFKRGGIE